VQSGLSRLVNVLLVDDNPTDVMVVKEALSEVATSQFGLMQCGSLKQGITCLGENGVDLVLLDLTLPDSEGLDTLHRIFQRANSIPIVVLTGFHDENIAIRAVKEGAQDYLMKEEISGPLLTRAIRYAIERKRKEELEELVGQRTAELGRTNEALLVEISKRKQVQATLESVLSELESKVKARTSELERSHEALLAEMAGRKELQEQLLQSQKMEAIGRLAGGIAHDFNNLLTAVIGYCELLLERFQEEDSTRGLLNEIHKAGMRAAALTHQLLAFSRKQMLQPEVLEFNETITGLEKVLRRIIGEDIELTFALDPDVGQVKADRAQLDEVVMNLAANARDAMPQGGKLIIETKNVELDDSYTQGRLEVKPGSYVMMAMSDTGCGIEKEILPKIFEPFFTTKERGKGTGLGLSTLYGIVRQTGGDVMVHSEVGKGTTFKIYLPRTDEALDTRPHVVSLADMRAKETILVTEDERGVRKLVHRVLEKYGYTVLVAARGHEAIKICKEYAGPIDMLVTDVVMPEMSGKQLSELVTQLRPEIRVLFMSGYTAEAILHQGKVDRSTAFVQKPFAASALAQKVREMLDAKVSELCR
jgi:signal transduction histidine kinase